MAHAQGIVEVLIHQALLVAGQVLRAKEVAQRGIDGIIAALHHNGRSIAGQLKVLLGMSRVAIVVDLPRALKEEPARDEASGHIAVEQVDTVVYTYVLESILAHRVEAVHHQQARVTVFVELCRVGARHIGGEIRHVAKHLNQAGIGKALVELGHTHPVVESLAR